MANAEYSLITIAPHKARLDRVVVGVVIFRSGTSRVVFTYDFQKVQSINPSYGIDSFHALRDRIAELAEGCENTDQLRVIMRMLGTSVQLSAFKGDFGYSDEYEYKGQLDKIMDESVDVPKKPAELLRRRAQSKLRTSLRKQFESMGILGKDSSDVDHKVAQKYPIQEDQGLYADFAMKNTFMHVTSTVDFTLSEQSFTAKKYETQAKCLVLRAAEEKFGRDTRKFVVVAGGYEKNARAAINLLQANANVFRFENAKEMAVYLGIIEDAAQGNRPLN